MNNRLLDMQEMIFKQMKRLDNDKLSIEELTNEVSRSNALSNNALTILKTINVNIRIAEMSEKYQKTKDAINKELGL